MRLPCEMCNNYTIQEVGHRVFIGCDDEKKKKEGFHEDTFLYHHTCDNLNVREECKNCSHNKGQYCNSVMAFVDGKCIDRIEK